MSSAEPVRVLGRILEWGRMMYKVEFCFDVLEGHHSTFAQIKTLIALLDHGVVHALRVNWPVLTVVVIVALVSVSGRTIVCGKARGDRRIDGMNA